jgi:hypothetical protein
MPVSREYSNRSWSFAEVSPKAQQQGEAEPLDAQPLLNDCVPQLLTALELR